MAKRLIARAKRAMKKAFDFGQEGTAELRLAWEIRDLVAVEGMKKSTGRLSAAAAAQRPKMALAPKRMAALAARKHPISAAAAAAAPVMDGQANWTQIGPIAIPRGQ